MWQPLPENEARTNPTNQAYCVMDSPKALVSEALAADRHHLWHPFSSLEGPENLLVESASGPYLYTSCGRRLLDAVSSWWVNLHGHAHPAIAQAIAAQAQTLEHVIFAGFTHRPAIELASRLLPLLPGGQERLFFSDNGSTAVEVGLKMAFQYFWNQGRPRRQVIALEGAYHGDTFGSMSVGGRGPFNQPFAPFLFDTVFVPFPAQGQEEATFQAFCTALESQETAAFIFEPLIQGAGGMRVYSPELLSAMVAEARSHGALCIADEVMTGFGRTGRLFATDSLAHAPDIVCLSKGITGGFMPLGATACNASVASAFAGKDRDKVFFHGHSYTANPLACAAALASLDLLCGDACQADIRRVSAAQAAFAERANAQYPGANARACGTIAALDMPVGGTTSYFNNARDMIYRFFLDRDILLRPLGNTVYVLPPYITASDELDRVHAAVFDLLAQQAGAAS